ncbi:hypothetical protein NHX12_029801 [Muraenolepis orangiensis]|uniref:Uncharacterized protein n=1 Tax=Muraenolepis orangiensis TaxID=630683 RepID=A0A9Q0EA20_9TELE|nr:hypothetical protein NHX12_029801 [Muraenolepis orangiensis]
MSVQEKAPEESVFLSCQGKCPLAGSTVSHHRTVRLDVNHRQSGVHVIGTVLKVDLYRPGDYASPEPLL